MSERGTRSCVVVLTGVDWMDVVLACHVNVSGRVGPGG